LIFIGIKLVLVYLHETWHHLPKISTGLSLGVIALVLAVGVIASLRHTARHPQELAHPGRLSQ
jgi:tellurite resistance protein TerC